jgi:hypothetical protein
MRKNPSKGGGTLMAWPADKKKRAKTSDVSRSYQYA